MAAPPPFPLAELDSLASSARMNQSCLLPKVGIRVSFATAGSCHSDAVRVLVIPGLGSNRMLILGFHHFCLERNVELYCVDRPGYGETEPWKSDALASKDKDHVVSAGSERAHTGGKAAGSSLDAVEGSNQGSSPEDGGPASSRESHSVADQILSKWAEVLDEFTELQGLKTFGMMTFSCGALYGLAFINRLNRKLQENKIADASGTALEGRKTESSLNHLPQNVQESTTEGDSEAGTTTEEQKHLSRKILEPVLLLVPFLAVDPPPTLSTMQKGPVPFFASAASVALSLGTGMLGPWTSVLSCLGAASAFSGLSSSAQWGSPKSPMDAAISKMLVLESKSKLPASQRGSSFDIRVCLGNPKLDWAGCPFKLAAVVGSENWVTSSETVLKFVPDSEVIPGAGHNLTAQQFDVVFKKLKDVLGKYKDDTLRIQGEFKESELHLKA